MQKECDYLWGKRGTFENLFLQEVLETGGHVQEHISCEHILDLIETTIKTAVETSSSLVSFQCQRITEGLHFARSWLISNTTYKRVFTVFGGLIMPFYLYFLCGFFVFYFYLFFLFYETGLFWNKLACNVQITCM